MEKLVNTARILSTAWVLCVIGYVAGCSRLEEAKSPLDDRYIQGVLKNGMQYYIYPTDKEPNKVSIQVLVKTGSLYENENELGLSHYIEHMAFNATEKYSREDFSRLENELGIQFGRNSNAYTSFDQVVYDIALQNPSEDRLETVFDIMSQRAFYMNFDPQEVENERGVILAEKQVRESDIHYEKYLFKLGKKLPNTRYTTNVPIGVEHVITAATPEQMKALYKKWYHPKRMAVSVVGDIVQDEVQGYLEHYFGSYVPTTPEAEEPNFPTRTSTDTRQVFGYHDANRFSVTLEIARVEAFDFKSDLVISSKPIIITTMISRYINNRFNQYLKYKKFDSALLDVYFSFQRLMSKEELVEYQMSFDIDEDNLEQGLSEVQVFLATLLDDITSDEACDILYEGGMRFIEHIETIEQPSIDDVNYDIVNAFFYQIPFTDNKKFAELYGEDLVHSIGREEIYDFFKNMVYDYENTYVFLEVGNTNKALLHEDNSLVEHINIDALFATHTATENIFGQDAPDIDIDAVIGTREGGAIVNEEVYSDTLSQKAIYTWTLDNGLTVLYSQVEPQEEHATQLAIIADSDTHMYANFVRRHPFLDRIYFNALDFASYNDILLSDLLDVDEFEKVDVDIDSVLYASTNDQDSIEHVFRMVHLLFTVANVQKTGFIRAKNAIITEVQESKKDPYYYTFKFISDHIKQHFPNIKKELSVETARNISFEQVQEINDVMFSSRDTLFSISGSIDAKEARLLVEQWVASLTIQHTHPINTAKHVVPIDSLNTEITREDVQQIALLYKGILKQETKPHTYRDKVINALVELYVNEVVSNRIREDLGGAYYVHAAMNYIGYPYAPTTRFMVFFPTEISKVHRLTQELEHMLSNITDIDTALFGEKNIVYTTHIQSFYATPDVDKQVYEQLSNYNVGLPLFVPPEKIIAMANSITADEIAQKIADIMSAKSSTISIISLPTQEQHRFDTN